MTVDDMIRRNFLPHEMSEEASYASLRIRRNITLAAHEAATCMVDGREKSLVLTKLEEALFFANAGLARDGVRS